MRVFFGEGVEVSALNVECQRMSVNERKAEASERLKQDNYEVISAYVHLEIAIYNCILQSHDFLWGCLQSDVEFLWWGTCQGNYVSARVLMESATMGDKRKREEEGDDEVHPFSFCIDLLFHTPTPEASFFFSFLIPSLLLLLHPSRSLLALLSLHLTLPPLPPLLPHTFS